MLWALAVTAPFVPNIFLSHVITAYAVTLYHICNMVQTLKILVGRVD
jgi:hypothetical protein